MAFSSSAESVPEPSTSKTLKARTSDASLAPLLQGVAHTLEDLNVRGVRGFGDASAFALAHGVGVDGLERAGLVRLNASCTGLTGKGLVAISRASSRLRVLDLCYADAVQHIEKDAEPPADLLETLHKHGERLRMLGLGGSASFSMCCTASA